MALNLFTFQRQKSAGWLGGIGQRLAKIGHLLARTIHARE